LGFLFLAVFNGMQELMAFFNVGNNKRMYLIVAVVLVIGVAYWVVHEDFSPALEQQLSPIMNGNPHTNFAANTSANVSDDTAHKQQALTTAGDKTVPEFGAVAAGKSIAPDAWRVGDATVATPQIPLPAGVSVYEPVSLDMENPEYPEPGEQLTVVMPGGDRLGVNVETNITNPNGDYTWRGHLDGHGDEYPVVMTYGGNSVFATVTTPKGSYTLISVNGSGWIYKNPSEFELSHPGANDYLEIPHEHK
jgi:hypothetical protein